MLLHNLLLYMSEHCYMFNKENSEIWTNYSLNIRSHMGSALTWKLAAHAVPVKHQTHHIQFSHNEEIITQG
jgi:hypothetical protein